MSYQMMPLLPQTKFDTRNVDSRGKTIRNSEELKAIRRTDRFTTASDPERRNVVKALSEIKRVAERLGIGSAAEQEACSIYLKAFHLGLIRGRSIFGIGTASVYLACRKQGIPRSIEEVAEFSQNEDRREIASYCKLLIRKLEISLALPTVQAHVAQIARNAGLAPLTQREALSILTLNEGNASLCGRRPSSLAAAALYLASRSTGEHKSQLRIASAANLSLATLRKSSLEMERFLEEKNNSNNPVETKSSLAQLSNTQGSLSI
ncbi:MAG: hypothetical protein M1368_00185 [Thaumarchaeota archaeon]|nr:hypothetical protein [Nitrososphaerota archaeon]